MEKLILCNAKDVECFKALYEIESYIRLIVLWELKGNYGLSWKGVIPEELIREITKRQNQEIQLGCVEVNNSNLLSYLNLSELKDLLVNTDLWELSFRSYWGAQDIVLSDFKRLIAVRNKMAHFRSVSTRDVRLVNRFLEDLNYRTKNYDTIRNVWNRINKDNESDPPNKLYKFDFIKEFIGLIRKADAFVKNKVSIFLLESNWAVQFYVVAGSINGDEFINLIDKYQKIISICRIGSLGEKIELQFSRAIPLSKSIELIKDTLQLCVNTVDGISSMESIDTYKINMREDVIPWDLQFPCSSPIGFNE